MPADSRFAAAIADAAGALLLDLRDPALDARELGRRGDLSANELLLERISARYPRDAILSEESTDDPARLRAARVWIIDPLDGTREYVRAGRTDWAVHVALWSAGAIAASAVALPALGVVLADDDVVPAPRSGPRRLLVSDSRPPAFAAPVAADLDAELVPMGSAGAKAMAVVRGEADAYLHAGGQWEWDSAAPVGVASAAGLRCTRIDGSPLRYNQPHPYLPDLLIARPELAGNLLAAIARHTSPPR